jgi:hypothetical protein
MRAHPKPSATRSVIIPPTNRFISKALHKAVVAISVFACSFFGIEGGYQLHLSHDHPALRCVELALAASGNQIDGPPSLVAPPPCREPDVIGQPWRLEFVLDDMLGFLIFGTLCIESGKRLIAADIAGT